MREPTIVMFNREFRLCAFYGPWVSDGISPINKIAALNGFLAINLSPIWFTGYVCRAIVVKSADGKETVPTCTLSYSAKLWQARGEVWALEEGAIEGLNTFFATDPADCGVSFSSQEIYVESLGKKMDRGRYVMTYMAKVAGFEGVRLGSVVERDFLAQHPRQP
jgi:hypothetical protein